MDSFLSSAFGRQDCLQAAAALHKSCVIRSGADVTEPRAVASGIKTQLFNQVQYFDSFRRLTQVVPLTRSLPLAVL